MPGLLIILANLPFSLVSQLRIRMPPRGVLLIQSCKAILYPMYFFLSLYVFFFCFFFFELFFFLSHNLVNEENTRLLLIFSEF